MLHEWPYGDLQLAYLAPPADDEFHVAILGGGIPLTGTRYADLGDSLRPEGYHHLCLTVDCVREALEELRRRQVKVIAEPFVRLLHLPGLTPRS